MRDWVDNDSTLSIPGKHLHIFSVIRVNKTQIMTQKHLTGTCTISRSPDLTLLLCGRYVMGGRKQRSAKRERSVKTIFIL